MKRERAVPSYMFWMGHGKAQDWIQHSDNFHFIDSIGKMP